MSPAKSEDLAPDELRSYFERWLAHEEAKAAISNQLRALFAEAKAKGYDPKVLRNVFRDKTEDQARRSEVRATYDMYWAALDASVAAGADTAQPEPATLAPATTDTPEEVAVTRERSGSEVETGREVFRSGAALGTPVASRARPARPARTSPTLTSLAVAASENDPIQAEDPAPDAVVKGLDGAAGGTGFRTPAANRAHSTQVEPVPPPAPTTIDSLKEKAAEPEKSPSGVTAGPENLSRATSKVADTSVCNDALQGTPPTETVSAAVGESLHPSSFVGPTDIRPYCRNPKTCAGAGRKHCHSCERADVDRGPRAQRGDAFAFRVTPPDIALADRTCQNSLTVVRNAARLVWPGGTVEWIIFASGPSMMNRMSAPAGDLASGLAESVVSFTRAY